MMSLILITLLLHHVRALISFVFDTEILANSASTIIAPGKIILHIDDILKLLWEVPTAFAKGKHSVFIQLRPQESVISFLKGVFVVLFGQLCIAHIAPSHSWTFLNWLTIITTPLMQPASSTAMFSHSRTFLLHSRCSFFHNIFSCWSVVFKCPISRSGSWETSSMRHGSRRMSWMH